MITGILYLNYPFKVSYLSLFLSILACRPQYDEEISVEMIGYNVKCNSMVAHGSECVVVCSYGHLKCWRISGNQTMNTASSIAVLI